MSTILNSETKTISIFSSNLEVVDNIKGFNVLSDLKSFMQKLDAFQYESLRADIEKNGILSPVQFLNIGGEKIVVDGHIRLNIAEELGLQSIPEFEINEDFESLEELKIWMVKNQCQRRNISRNLRIKMAYSLKSSIAEIAKRNLVLAGKNEEVVNKIDTLEEIAKIAGVSRTTIARYQSVLENASDEIKHKMVEGDISVNNAFEAHKSASPKNVSPINDSYKPKPNYYKVNTAKDAEKMVKSGELDFILIIKKGKEDLIPETLNKTGLVIIE